MRAVGEVLYNSERRSDDEDDIPAILFPSITLLKSLFILNTISHCKCKALKGPCIKIPSGPFYRYGSPVSRNVVTHAGAPVAWGPRIIDTAIATPPEGIRQHNVPRKDMLKSVLKDHWEKISAEETTRFVSLMLKRL
ncbi:hypothetical protein TNCV_3418941 [Trichonephila clavipes]|nr:hypothetical protein TNCV_3418941 [Trichonephila clavipes]